MTTLFNFNIKKTGVIYYPEKKIIRNFQQIKIKKLSNEFDGFNWYLKKNKF